MVNARFKFILGGILILGTSGYLMASSIRETGMYYFTPTELAAKIDADSTFRDVGVKVGALVVAGSVQRDPNGRQVAFVATDGERELKVVHRGLIPDTFSDSAEVVVEGRLGADGTFQSTVLLAKCASRFEAAPDKNDPRYRDIPGYQNAIKPKS